MEKSLDIDDRTDYTDSNNLKAYEYQNSVAKFPKLEYSEVAADLPQEQWRLKDVPAHKTVSFESLSRSKVSSDCFPLKTSTSIENMVSNPNVNKVSSAHQATVLKTNDKDGSNRRPSLVDIIFDIDSEKDFKNGSCYVIDDDDDVYLETIAESRARGRTLDRMLQRRQDSTGTSTVLLFEP